MDKKRIISVTTMLLLFCIIIAGIAGCAKQTKAYDLMSGFEAKSLEGRDLNKQFVDNTHNFAINLFEKTYESGKNTLISPLSVMVALAMTTNGADGNTLKQMENLLGGGIPIDELNGYLYTLINTLPDTDKAKLKMANSIWFRDEKESLRVNSDFLQVNANYYQAGIYKADFNSPQTVKDINNWIKNNTDDMIDTVIDKIDADTIMYLINALIFDAEWKKIYKKNDIYKGTFKAYDGSEKSGVEFMVSEESRYFQIAEVEGFVKPYHDDIYSFVALLPSNPDVELSAVLDKISGADLLKAIKDSGKTVTSTTVHLPKFKYEYSTEMSKVLRKLGMPDAFDSAKANFTKLGESSYGNIYIGRVIHKTYISVDELGTKAGAVTVVEIKNESAVLEEKIIKLNRPFIYMIIENETGIPIFIGSVQNVEV